MNLRSKLEFIEEQLESYVLLHKLLFLAVILILIGYFSYIFIFEPYMQELEEKKLQLQELNAKIKKSKKLFYLKQIKKFKNDILLLRTDIENLKKKKIAILEEMHKNNAMYVTNENFAKLLDKILFESKKYNLALNQILIYDKEVPYLGKIFEKKELNISGQGEFLEIVKFLRSIESSEILLKIDNLLIETNGSIPTFSFLLKLYGGTL